MGPDGAGELPDGRIDGNSGVDSIRSSADLREELIELGRF
jgi:hypothetical protein